MLPAKAILSWCLRFQYNIHFCQTLHPTETDSSNHHESEKELKINSKLFSQHKHCKETNICSAKQFIHFKYQSIQAPGL